MDDALHDFLAESVPLTGGRRTVYRAGHGPPVIVLAEMPGISPDVARFARWVRDAGFTVVMPSLFGRDGGYPDAESGAAVLRETCLRAEFGALVRDRTSPIVDVLRALARWASEQGGGQPVGVVGMCFTGGYALCVALEPTVRASVLCQPSLPFGAPDGLPCGPEDLAAVRARLDAGELSVRAYRFEGDPHCPRARFDAYRAALGPRFVTTTLPDACANPDPPPFFRDVVRAPHSVVTAHYVDAPGHPTRRARDEILAFLRHELLGARHA